MGGAGVSGGGGVWGGRAEVVAESMRCDRSGGGLVS